jgi:hypothetical protein
MKVIRGTVTQGVTAFPPKKKSCPKIEVMVNAVRFGIGFLDGRRLG